MTALRELLSELMSACEMIGYATSGIERANHRATRDKLKAELLSILDAEGDGGAVGDAWKLGMAVLQSDLYEQLSDEDRAICDAFVATNPHIKTTHPQPPRSGVVSDDARDAERFRWLRDNGERMIGRDRGCGPEWTYGDELDQAIDAAIKSQGESNV